PDRAADRPGAPPRRRDTFVAGISKSRGPWRAIQREPSALRGRLQESGGGRAAAGDGTATASADRDYALGTPMTRSTPHAPGQRQGLSVKLRSDRFARDRPHAPLLAVGDDDAVVAHFAVVIGEERRRFAVHDRALELFAGERADRVERLPPRDHDDFDAAVLLAFHQARAAVSRDRRELRQHDAAEVFGILLRAVARGSSRPDAFDHQSALGGGVSSAPTTTFHGRARHATTSPSRTYGSARANS